MSGLGRAVSAPFRAVANALAPQRATASNVTHVTNNPSSPGFDPSGLQNQIDQLRREAADFSAWRQGRQSALGSEAAQRSTNQQLIEALQRSTSEAARNLTQSQTNLASSLGGLRTDFSGLGQQVTNLGDTVSAQGQDIAGNIEGISGLGAGFDQLSADQKKQVTELFNLAQAGKGVKGVKTSQGITFTQPRGIGTGALNRDALTFGSLNLA